MSNINKTDENDSSPSMYCSYNVCKIQNRGQDECESRPVCIQKMNYEKFRIESYKNWPIPWIDVKDLAATGLYYLGFDDICECAFCGIKIRSWEAEDIPKKEHQRWSPYCPLLEGKFCNNIKLKHGESETK